MGDPSKLTAWERWELASFDAPPAAPADAPREAEPPRSTDSADGADGADGAEVEDTTQLHLPTAEELEQIQQQARDEGFAQGQEEGRLNGHEEGFTAGREAGYADGQAAAQQEAERLAQLVGQLEQSLATLESSVADELLALAVALAREVVRHEIGARPERLLDVVREALSSLPHQHAAIYLHPEDAALLRTHLGEQMSHSGHRIHEDFKLQRGDCMIEAGGTQIDATVAMRWQRVLGGLGIDAAWATPALAAGAEDARSDVHNEP